MNRRLALAATLLTCASVGVGPALADPGPAPSGPATAPVEREQRRLLHSSDGVVGPIAPVVPASRRGEVSKGVVTTEQVVPGVTYSTWDQKDARGPVRLSLLTVSSQQPDLKLEYAAPRKVARTLPLPQMMSPLSVAGVNGDFFDIGDTGAPLGLGKSREKGLAQARRDGWNSAFYVGKHGQPDIGTLPLKARIVQRPTWAVTNVNSPSVAADGIGVYTRAWGRTTGNRIVDGATTGVRMVEVRGNRVVAKRKRLPTGTKITGSMLVGRGAGAQKLKMLRKGSRVDLRLRVATSPRVAITGNKFLVLDGVVTAVDDREMHPRTAIGIDRETGSVLMLAVDGRQSFSRGYTMVELANMMVQLGAEDALNLDGGGSTTMVTRDPAGVLRTRNSPSDGGLRSVANGLQVLRTP